METNYIGKVDENGHIFLICENEKGQRIQVPHVELFTDGLVALPIPEESEPKAPYKRLTKKEIALFFNGMDTNGNVLEKPSESLKKATERHNERMATDEEYRKAYEQICKGI